MILTLKSSSLIYQDFSITIYTDALFLGEKNVVPALLGPILDVNRFFGKTPLILKLQLHLNQYGQLWYHIAIRGKRTTILTVHYCLYYELYHTNCIDFIQFLLIFLSIMLPYYHRSDKSYMAHYRLARRIGHRRHIRPRCIGE